MALKPTPKSKRFSATLTPVGRLSAPGRVLASVIARRSLTELRLDCALLNVF